MQLGSNVFSFFSKNSFSLGIFKRGKSDILMAQTIFIITGRYFCKISYRGMMKTRSDSNGRGKKEVFQLYKEIGFQVDKCQVQIRSGNPFMSISFCLSSFVEVPIFITEKPFMVPIHWRNFSHHCDTRVWVHF